MSDFLKGLAQGLFGPREEDPLGSVTPEQLGIVLKSIEDKFAALQDENARLRARLAEGKDELHARIEAQQREIEALKHALTEQAVAEPLLDEVLQQARLVPDEAPASQTPRFADVMLLAQDLEDGLDAEDGSAPAAWSSDEPREAATGAGEAVGA